MRACLIWQRFGPYHLARLRAATRRFQAEDAELVGVEVVEQEGLHRWRRETQADVCLTTLFSGVAPKALSRRHVFKSVSGLLDRIDPHAVAVPAYSTPAAQAGLTWARDRRRIAVVMTATSRDDAVRFPARERAKRAIVSQFDAALAGGTPQARYIHDLGIPADRIFIPYDVVDNDFYARAATTARANPSAFRYLPGLDTGNPFFLASGRFIDRKNFGHLVRAYAEYVAGEDRIVPWDLVIMGDGPRRAAVSHLADTIVHRGNVIFAGYRQPDEVAIYYGLAEAFVHPATVDQWGLVINEAMAAGLPVVVSRRAGAVEDLLSDGVNGYTFDAEEPSAIAGALRRIAAPDADRRAMGRRSQARVASWSLERFADGLWDAVAAGAASSDRRLSLPARLLIRSNQIAPKWALRWRSVEP